MLRRVTGSSSVRPAKMFSCTSPPFRWTATSRSTKVRRWNLKSRRARRAFRQRTLQASSLFSGSPGCCRGSRPKRFKSRFETKWVKEDVVQVMAEGQTIKHEVYGLGIVTASDAERTSVDFDDHGPKLFVTSIMTAELIGEAPATPPKTKRRRKASAAAKAAKKAAAAASRS